MTVWKKTSLAKGALPRPALFLDRDGVIIADEDYLADPKQVRILPGVPGAMASAREAGYLLVGVSNQSGIGRGYFSEAEFNLVMLRLEELLAHQGASFDSFHYCPHEPGAQCSCRKPGLGLLDEVQRVLPVDLTRSWMIGDKASDVAFGRSAGMGSVLVRTGYGAAQEKEVLARWSQDPRVTVAEDMAGAVEGILASLAEDGPQ